MPSIKLSPLQIAVLKFFGENKFGHNFYWTGGTLLAQKYLHHRGSVDLDFFSEDLYRDEDYLIFINELKKKTQANKITVTLENNRRLYLVKRDQQVIKLELVYFPFPPLEKRGLHKDYKLSIDSLTDLMANKTLAAYQRYEVKDLYDLYYYLTSKPAYNLGQLIKMVEKKFGLTIEIINFLAKMNELASNLNSLKPLLLRKEPDLQTSIKQFFQNQFNIRADKLIK